MCEEGASAAEGSVRAAAMRRRSAGCMTRLIVSPFRGLRRFRDMYVKSLRSCIGGGAARSSRKEGKSTKGVKTGVVAINIMPRTGSRSAFFAAPDDDDFRELVRVNSKQVVDDVSAANNLQSSNSNSSSSTDMVARPEVTVVLRSQSVAAGIGRIDENRPYCEFDVEKLGIPTSGSSAAAYSRSRSCAVVPTERRSTTVTTAGFNKAGGLK